MYVLSLENGYAQVEQNDAGGYDLIEQEGGTVCKLKVGKRNKDVRIISIGQIVTDRYNKSLQSYKDAGGTVEEVLRLHETGKKKVAPPYPPTWIYPKKKPAEQSLTGMKFSDMPYIKVCYIQFMGELTPVFSVNSLSELYFYDLFRMKAAGVLIRECMDCGRAFPAKTTAVRCEDCRKAGMGERKKQSNLKNNPTRSLIKQIKDRVKKRPTSDSFTEGYLKHIGYVVGMPEEADLSCVQVVDSLDRKYWKRLWELYQHMQRSNNSDLKEKWQKDWYNLFTQNDPEKWISDWEEKAY